MKERHYLENMKSPYKKNGRLERLAYAGSKQKLNSLIDSLEERNWKVEGEIYTVDRYLCQKMIFVREEAI